MTAEEKKIIVHFLDLAGDYLKDGYMHKGTEYNFSDDKGDDKGQIPKEPNPTDIQSDKNTHTNFSALPLAYQVDENDDSDNNGESSPYSSLDDIAARIHNCTACGLSSARKHPVPGEGVSNPLVMVIGEGPGADEDATGRPFVGKAGQLLDKMLSSIGLSRNKNCYIANMVKCRPPGNRNPDASELTACFPFLEKQIAIQNPAIILCAGKVAAQNLLKTDRSISSLRGIFTVYRCTPINGYSDGSGKNSPAEREIPVLCTFHPSALLRDEALKRPAWEDLKLLRERLLSINAEYDVIPNGDN